MTKASGKHPFNLLAYRHAVRAYYTHHLRQTPPPTAYNARNITTSPRVDPRLLLASYPEESTAYFFSFSLSLFPSFLPSFFSLSPLSPRPATTTLFSPHGLYFFARDANDTGIYGDATIISHSERKKERKKDFLEGRKEREKKDFLPFLSLLGLLPFLVSTRGILLSQFYRLANDRRRERLRRR